MTLKSAVVGGGAVSGDHLSGLSRHPDVDLRAVCDADESRAGDRAAAFDVRAYGDFEGMLALESLDWLHVCTPTPAHAEQARMAMADGVAVHVESPLATDPESAKELATIADERSVPASVAHDGVFESALLEADRRICSGAIGDPRAVDLLYTGQPWPAATDGREWVGDLPGGAFEVELARPVSQVVRLGGFPPERAAIDAGATRRRDGAEDFDFDGATFQYTTASGVCCSGTVLASDSPQRTIRVHGEDGTLVADLLAGTVSVGERGGSPSMAESMLTDADAALSRLRDAGADLVSRVRRSTSDDGGPFHPRTTLDSQIDTEVTAIENGDPMPVPIEAGVWTVEVVDAIRSAASTEEAPMTVTPEMDPA